MTDFEGMIVHKHPEVPVKRGSVEGLARHAELLAVASLVMTCTRVRRTRTSKIMQQQ